MDKENKKIPRLNIAIGLALAMLLAIVIVIVKTDQERLTDKESQVFVKEAEPEKKVISKPRQGLPPIEEIALEPVMEPVSLSLIEQEKMQEIEEEKEGDLSEVMLLKDLAVDSIIADQEAKKDKTMDQEIEEDVQAPSFETQPSPEDIKKLQQKGLIIY